MNKINEFLIKAANEPDFNDASIYLKSWHNLKQLSTDEIDKVEDQKLMIQFAKEKRTIKPVSMETKIDDVVCAEVIPFIKDSNLTDIRDLIVDGVTGHLSTVTFFHTEEHQEHLLNLQSINSIFGKLIEIKKHFIENEKGRFSQVLENL